MALLSVPMVSLYLGYVIGQTGGPPTQPLEGQVFVQQTSSLNKSARWTRRLAADTDGGLGSRMFMFASLYGIALWNYMLPIMPDDSYLSSVFPYLEIETTDAHAPPELIPVFHERHAHRYDHRSSRLNYHQNIRLEGRYQSWKYFDHAKDKLKQQFVFSPSIDREANSFMTKAKEKFADPWQNVVFVSIHVRRGDLLEKHNKHLGYNVAPASYIQNAMEHFLSKYQNVIFIVSSDDRRWTMGHITSGGLGVMHSLQGPASLDLAILSKCNHSILTVGAFGWWGAWLAGGETVYYRRFPVKGSLVDAHFRSEDFYYPNWIGMQWSLVLHQTTSCYTLFLFNRLHHFVSHRRLTHQCLDKRADILRMRFHWLTRSCEIYIWQIKYFH